MQEKNKQAQARLSVSGNVYFGLHAAPPHRDHMRILQALCDDSSFARVTAVVAGRRKDKPEYCAPAHRREMMRLAADDLREQCRKRLVVDDRDIERLNTPTYEYIQAQERKDPSVLVWFVIGADCVAPRDEWGGMCVMQKEWYRGKELYESKNFVVIPRKGFPHPQTFRLPKNFSIKEVCLKGISSEKIRERIQSHQSIEEWVVPAVAQYIEAHNLFQA